MNNHFLYKYEMIMKVCSYLKVIK